MAKWFLCDCYDDEIKEVNAIKETHGTLIITTEWGDKPTKRVNKKSEYHQYFPSLQGAVSYKRTYLVNKINSLKIQIERAQQKLDALNKKYQLTSACSGAAQKDAQPTDA